METKKVPLKGIKVLAKIQPEKKSAKNTFTQEPDEHDLRVENSQLKDKLNRIKSFIELPFEFDNPKEVINGVLAIINEE